MNRAIILPLPLAILLAFVGLLMVVIPIVFGKQADLPKTDRGAIVVAGALLVWAGFDSAVRLFS